MLGALLSLMVALPTAAKLGAARSDRTGGGIFRRASPAAEGGGVDRRGRSAWWRWWRGRWCGSRCGRRWPGLPVNSAIGRNRSPPASVPRCRVGCRSARAGYCQHLSAASPDESHPGPLPRPRRARGAQSRGGRRTVRVGPTAMLGDPAEQVVGDADIQLALVAGEDNVEHPAHASCRMSVTRLAQSCARDAAPAACDAIPVSPYRRFASPSRTRSGPDTRRIERPGRCRPARRAP